MLVSRASEITALSHRLDDISERNRHYREFTLNGLTFAIREVIACLSVYRTYADGTKGEVSERDRRYIDAAVEEAKKRNPRTARAIFDFVGDTMSLRNLNKFRAEDRQAVIDFVMKFQQLTGPVMAKGVEDTAFYVYNRLISLNEVGGDPETFGASAEAFHRQNGARLKCWPHAMTTLATHDTKRGEDARARIDALSEIAPEWRAALLRWRKLNEVKKSLVDGELAPDANDEYLFYQALCGAWPAAPPAAAEFHELRQRMAAYMQKAIKEAKVHTSWVNPNEAYVQAMEKFVAQVLDLESGDGFITDFSQLHGRIAYAGMLNSLSQTLLKITSPGVPDFYQGTELWDFSLVDPDNRRPVDFVKRGTFLEELKRGEKSDRAGMLCDLLSHWQDGRVKLYLIYKALNFRCGHPEVFQRGRYLPLYVAGNLGENVCAFARRADDRWVVAAAPRLLTRVVTPGCPPLGERAWKDAVLPLPSGAPDHWHNVLTGEKSSASETKGGEKGLPLHQIFKSYPVALLEGEQLSG
jgi:(1->4)-alpha-D-glucan 1-alpha-D-glucosylmutase